MVGVTIHEGEYHLGSRMPVMARDASAPALQIAADGPGFFKRLVARQSSDDCVNGEPSNLCEKPVTSQTLALPIALGVTIPLVALVVMLIWLHRKNVRRQRQEDANDPHKSLDFGLDMGPGKRKSKLFGGEKLGGGPHNRQISMDMNLSSPYLLPPNMQNSRESIHSLAKTLHNEDPYRHITQYNASDAGSLRSYKAGGMDRPIGPKITVPTSRKGSLQATSPTSTIGSVPPRYEASQDDYVKPPPPAALKSPTQDSTPYPDDKSGPLATVMPSVPEIQEPKPASLSKESSQAPSLAAVPPSSPLAISAPEIPSPSNDNYKAFDFSQDPAYSPPTQPLPQLPTINTELAAPAPLNLDRQPMTAPIIGEGQYAENLEEQVEERGRSQHRRQSSEYPPEPSLASLGLPQQDNKRLSVGFQDNKRHSVGFRPLPPSEVTESEDPETRANRIRSFYKEYFDDSKNADPMPPLQEGYNYHPGSGQGNNQGAQYYEDYDQSYLNDAAYYDPDTNSFVMPYAQPVARRAMTPPPSGSRFPGPRGGPRRPHAGSIGGMSLPGNRGPPRRPGSANSNGRWGPSPRPGSSASNPHNRGRAGSAMSASRKPMPPPAALTSLPNPSKLRDDSFAIMAAVDFAPPSTFKDQAVGRSQSPAGGERIAYQAPAIHSPLVSAFDEMAALPSPHLLRKSSTFTGLDFAPPRKFKDGDTMSDAGSIRSNRSGISAVQLGAIRSGAGRVSRLPGDQIFTKAAMDETLKPSWKMRD
ncbi:hypothetical protein MCOR31_006671 [Pyricularia oryzae]|nr:hypothetical protein MCOR31_006671 [Pyricularia oryzae]KAI6387141.1 hypothetical protein MCOR24_011109 [Pyricularia oryzae]